MYNPLPPVVGGGGVLTVLPATGVSFNVALVAAVGVLLVMAGLILVRSALGGQARFSSADE